MEGGLGLRVHRFSFSSEMSPWTLKKRIVFRKGLGLCVHRFLFSFEIAPLTLEKKNRPPERLGLRGPVFVPDSSLIPEKKRIILWKEPGLRGSEPMFFFIWGNTFNYRKKGSIQWREFFHIDLVPWTDMGAQILVFIRYNSFFLELKEAPYGKNRDRSLDGAWILIFGFMFPLK